MERFHCRFTTLILRVLQISASRLRICRFSVNKVDEKVMINYCVQLTVIIFTSLLHQSHSLVINAHHCHCTDQLLLVFIMMVVLLLPHSSAQTEWEPSRSSHPQSSHRRRRCQLTRLVSFSNYQLWLGQHSSLTMVAQPLAALWRGQPYSV